MNAIEQHYWPKFSGDPYLRHRISRCCVGRQARHWLASLVLDGATGSKDPFALRRASVAIIRLLLAFAPHANIKQ